MYYDGVLALLGPLAVFKLPRCGDFLPSNRRATLMEKDKDDKKDKSNKKNIFSKLFKKKKKDSSNQEKSEPTAPKLKTTYYAAITGAPDSSLLYFCDKFYVELYDLMYREQYSEEIHDRIKALSIDTTVASKIEGVGVNFSEILPPEISLKIFSVLDPRDLFYLSLVNKKSYEVLNDPKNWQTIASKREDLSSYESLTDYFRISLRPVSFNLSYENIDRTLRYDIRPDSRYWKFHTDDVDYSFFIVTVNFGKFDNQIGEDQSTNYLRRTADLLAEIARVPCGQSTSGLERTIVVVCTGGGDLRDKIDRKNISFQKYFPEATKVIQGSVMDIMDFMEDMYKARLSDVSLYGTIHLQVMELDSMNEYRHQHKVSHKIKDITRLKIGREKYQQERG